jgi:hypothetical protein
MYTDDVQVCATLRNFEADSEYLSFGDFWIQKLTGEDRTQLSRDLKEFTNYPGDNYILVRWYYIGRGKSSTVLRDNAIIFFFPLFRLLKLFKRGDLIMPLGFYSWNKKWYEMPFHGENYGWGYGLKGDPYLFKEKDIEPFNIFRKEMDEYLKHINFLDIPYRKKPKILSDIDTRCFLAIHLLLKGCVENNNPFSIIDRLVDYTTGLESLYLHGEENKRKNLSLRIAALLSKDEDDEKKLRNVIKTFYDIRSAVVHGSLLDKKKDDFLCEHIYEYGDYLRKSILAFLDLNLKNPTKKVVLKMIDETIFECLRFSFCNYFLHKHSRRAELRRDIQESLKLLKLAM